MLTHTTAWDQLWGGNAFLRLYIRSSALPRVAAVSTPHSYQSNSAAPSKHVFSDDELSEIFQIDFGQIFGNPDSGRSSNYKGIKKTKQEGKKCVGQI